MPATNPTLPPPPRRVVARSGVSTFGKWFLRLFILPHTLVGVGGLFAVPILFLWAVAGAVVQGEIVDKRTGMRQVSKSNGTQRYWEYAYAYPFGGSEYRKYGAFGPAEFGALPNEPAKIAALHRPVPVRVFGIGRFHYAEQADKNPWKTFGFAVFFVAFWNAVLSVFFYGAWIAPIRERQLVANGLARPGRIVGVSPGGKGSTRVAYEYQADGRPFSRKVGGVHRPSVVAYPEGSAVTVLVHPFNEKRSLVYELSNYRAEGERL